MRTAAVLAALLLGAVAVWVGFANGYALNALTERLWELEEDAHAASTL